MQLPLNRPAAFSALGLLFFPLCASATSVDIVASADTAIFGSYPDNNYGASTIGVGTNGVAVPARSLVEFDLSGIPAGATITVAEVTMTVVKVPPGDQRAGPAGSDFGLFRMLVPWTEGSGGGTTGTYGQPGETTWDERGAQGFGAWGQPGGQIGSDYANNPSTSTSVGPTTGPLVWGTSPAFVADVQSWLNDPSNNFGFMVISDGESTPGTARRLASRESASGSEVPPTLSITYIVPEPAAGFLLVLGGIYAGAGRRRHRQE